MPVLPQDTSAKDLSDAVQKPQDGNDGQSKRLATAQEHTAQPGIQLTGAENLGQPASKEELRKRAEELNK
ncbi:hypothetical protein AMS68_005845 [Peltaster fructicola]|uniref:Uncharacterized protein n=1 Tax=Peltaster fructicola TaxID=286661 RepID=A0A6H0Y0F4_9PEZI|nr:hypothetical protein AMS68_005845 [Peltaster fructicola]